MKKCPMMLKNVEYEYDRWAEPDKAKSHYSMATLDCIGNKCAAYHQQNVYDDGKIVTGKMRWSCANLPREIWHDVEESK